VSNVVYPGLGFGNRELGYPIPGMVSPDRCGIWRCQTSIAATSLGPGHKFEKLTLP